MKKIAVSFFTLILISVLISMVSAEVLKGTSVESNSSIPLQVATNLSEAAGIAETDAGSVFDVYANFPRTTNGENGIFLQYLSAGAYISLPYVQDYQFGIMSTDGRFLVPHVTRGSTNIYAHPSAVIQCGREADTVIRVTIPGSGGQVRVTGIAGVDLGSINFYIYKGADQYSSPLWSGYNGGAFDFSVSYSSGDQLFFAVDAGSNDINDWSWWRDIQLTWIPSLSFSGAKAWYWTSTTCVNSVVCGDTNSDGQIEIVTGGSYFDGTRMVAQLVVWSSELVVENVRTWYWIENTTINSVDLGDVDGDGEIEIVTVGTYFDGVRIVAQLCIWNGIDLALENVKTWWWNSDTVINSVALGNVDGDSQTEVVTGWVLF